MTLHVVNGDSTAATLRETSLGGDVLPWRDALHEGPLGTREDRAQFLAECGFGSYHGLLSDLVARDYALTGADNVVLWFEHDLYDQLQLVEILARRPANAALIQADVFLGELTPPELEALWPTRAPVTDRQLDLAAEVWGELVAGRIPLDRDFSALPFLGPALGRLAEDREDPPRSDRQLLEILGEGPRTRWEVSMRTGSARRLRSPATSGSGADSTRSSGAVSSSRRPRPSGSRRQSTRLPRVPSPSIVCEG